MLVEDNRRKCEIKSLWPKDRKNILILLQYSWFTMFISIRCTAQWFSHVYIYFFRFFFLISYYIYIYTYVCVYIFFFRFFFLVSYYKILISLCYAVVTSWLSILYMVACIYSSQPPNFSLPDPRKDFFLEAPTESQKRVVGFGYTTVEDFVQCSIP